MNINSSHSKFAAHIAAIAASSLIALSVTSCTISDVTVTRGEGIEEGQEIDLTGVKKGHDILKSYQKMGKDLDRISQAQ